MQSFRPTFRFRQFGIDDRRCGLKVGTDGVLLGAWTSCGPSAERILDVGAGSGLVGLMLAQRCPQAHVTAVEIESDSYADLCRNIAESPWVDRFTTIEGDFRSAVGKYDIIACNPPFFTNGDKAPAAARALARHASGLSPLSFVRFATGHLADSGRASLIAPSELDEAIVLEAALAGLYPCRITDVITSARRGITRRLWEFTTEPCPTPEPETIRVGSESFNKLTCDFYL